MLLLFCKSHTSELIVSWSGTDLFRNKQLESNKLTSKSHS